MFNDYDANIGVPNNSFFYFRNEIWYSLEFIDKSNQNHMNPKRQTPNPKLNPERMKPDKTDIVVFSVDMEAAREWKKREIDYFWELRKTWVYVTMIFIWFVSIVWLIAHQEKAESNWEIALIIGFLLMLVLLLGYLARRILILTKNHTRAEMIASILRGDLKEVHKAINIDRTY